MRLRKIGELRICLGRECYQMSLILGTHDRPGIAPFRPGGGVGRQCRKTRLQAIEFGELLVVRLYVRRLLLSLRAALGLRLRQAPASPVQRGLRSFEHLRHVPRLLRQAGRVVDRGLPPVGDRCSKERLLAAQVELARGAMPCDSSSLRSVVCGNPFISFIFVLAKFDRRKIKRRDIERPERVERLPGEVGAPIRRSPVYGQLRRIGGGGALRRGASLVDGTYGPAHATPPPRSR